MPIFTAFDPVARTILYSGTTADVSMLPHTAIEGIAVDASTHRVRLDGNGLEEKPQLEADFSATSITAGNTVTVSFLDAITIQVDGTTVASDVTEAEILFSDAGLYSVVVSHPHYLPQTQAITVNEP